MTTEAVTTQDNSTDALAGGHGGVNNAEDHEIHALYVRTIFMLVLVLISMNLNGALHKFKIHWISEAAATILIGLTVAVLFIAVSWSQENATIQLSSSFFYMVLLPPIIFEGGFAIRRVAFFKNVLNIVLLAFVGALYSTFVTSGLMYFFSKLCGIARVMKDGSTYMGLSLTESLVFGSMISSTDPVTVLSLLPSNVDKRLYMLIFGESALNDAVAIILYRFFSGIDSSDEAYRRWGIAPFVLSFIASAGVFLGSFVVGMCFALVYAKMTKHIRMHDGPIYETTMLIIFAYLSYLVADVMQLTGIISVFFCGIGMAHYAYPNLESTTTTSLKVTLRFIAFMCESFIFLYLGTGLLSFGERATYNPLMILFASISILVSRSHVFVLMGISNSFKLRESEKIPKNQQVLIWFSGLRGAVAFALGVTFLDHPHFDPIAKHVIFGTCVMVVVLTVFVLGGLTPHMLKWLKIVKSGESHDYKEAMNSHPQLNENGLQVIHDPEHGKKGQNGYTEMHEEPESLDDEVVQKDEVDGKSFFGMMYLFDTKYVQPFFTRTEPKEGTELVKSPHLAMSTMAEKQEMQRRMSFSEKRLSISSRKEKSPFDKTESTVDMMKSAQCHDVAELEEMSFQ